MIKKLRNQPYATKWEQEEKKRLNGVAAGLLIAVARTGFSLLATVTVNEFRESIFKPTMWRFSQPSVLSMIYERLVTRYTTFIQFKR
jgi:hypothetical protein